MIIVSELKTKISGINEKKEHELVEVGELELYVAEGIKNYLVSAGFSCKIQFANSKEEGEQNESLPNAN